jgi:aminoglycoside phosphotransferase (APT) family kinase protein
VRPAAEVEIGEELVRHLLAEQFPALDVSSARPLAEGWDNAVWVVEERWAFRFPRRAAAVPLLERELGVLPLLAPLLPVPVPEPVHVGRPSGRYPWPFVGTPLLPGREPADADLGEHDRVELGAALGRFLSVLHAPDFRAAVDPEDALPVDPSRRADMPARVQVARSWLGELERLGSWRASQAIERLFAAALDLGPAPAEAVVHGDLHVRHVLVEGGELTGIIDWGDVCRADAAVDLSLVWSLVGPAGREAFLREYGPVSEAQSLRARVLGVSLCAALASFARREGHVRLEREALAGLERTLVDWVS